MIYNDLSPENAVSKVEGVNRAARSRLPPSTQHQKDPGVDENPGHEADHGHGGQDGGLPRLEERLILDGLESQALF